VFALFQEGSPFRVEGRQRDSCNLGGSLQRYVDELEVVSQGEAYQHLGGEGVAVGGLLLPGLARARRMVDLAKGNPRLSYGDGQANASRSTAYWRSKDKVLEWSKGIHAAYLERTKARTPWTASKKQRLS
jgi:hypothetical protein